MNKVGFHYKRRFCQEILGVHYGHCLKQHQRFWSNETLLPIYHVSAYQFWHPKKMSKYEHDKILPGMEA
jgi:hypothetical protein